MAGRGVRGLAGVHRRTAVARRARPRKFEPLYHPHLSFNSCLNIGCAERKRQQEVYSSGWRRRPKLIGTRNTSVLRSFLLSPAFLSFPRLRAVFSACSYTIHLAPSQQRPKTSRGRVPSLFLNVRAEMRDIRILQIWFIVGAAAAGRQGAGALGCRGAGVRL